MMQPSAVVRATPFGANSTTWESTLSTSYRGEPSGGAMVFTAHSALRHRDRGAHRTLRAIVAAHASAPTNPDATAASRSIRHPCESILVGLRTRQPLRARNGSAIIVCGECALAHTGGAPRRTTQLRYAE